MKILAIDPGTTFSAFAIYDPSHPKLTPVTQKLHNTVMREYLPLFHQHNPDAELVVEMVESYGKPVGMEVFATVVWIGRFVEVWRQVTRHEPELLPRRFVKLHLCGATAKVTDAHVRQALIDRYGGESIALGGRRCKCKDGMTRTKVPRPCEACASTGWATKKGPLYDVAKDQWAALGVAITFANGVRWEK